MLVAAPVVMTQVDLPVQGHWVVVAEQMQVLVRVYVAPMVWVEVVAAVQDVQANQVQMLWLVMVVAVQLF
jgi:hypothetical protein